MNIDGLLDKAEELGWYVMRSTIECIFSQSSPAGLDFYFFIEMHDVHTADDMARAMRSYTNAFDTDAYAKMWIERFNRTYYDPDYDPDYDALVKDADGIQTMLNDLASAMENALTSRIEDENDQKDMILSEKQSIAATARQLIHQLQDCDDEEFVDQVVECVRDCDYIPIQAECL